MNPRIGLALLLLAVMPQVSADNSFDFLPLTESARSELTSNGSVLESEPWLLPAGFRQRILSDETHLNIYKRNDWTDMNTLNETGVDAGRYLYRTHEVRRINDAQMNGQDGGAVSVIDLKTGKAKLLASLPHWQAIDGIIWTPWGTLLVTEEQKNDSGAGDPQWPDAARGLVYEILLDPEEPTRVTDILTRPLLGSMTHEGIEIDAQGNVYIIDENPNGALFRFVPDSIGNLDAGTLYALKTSSGKQTGPAAWIPVKPDSVTLDARKAARKIDATGYCRPEDIERIGKTLYVALTCERMLGTVLSVGLDTETPVVRYFVEPGINIPREQTWPNQTGLLHPDNLADGPGGTLWISEDNIPGDIWVADPDRNGDGRSDRVRLFASLKDIKAEPSGIYFGHAPDRLFLSIQHSVTGNDKSIVIEPLAESPREPPAPSTQ